jgi:hypothetical protein
VDEFHGWSIFKKNKDGMYLGDCNKDIWMFNNGIDA